MLGSSWRGRSYDLGRMSFAELWQAYWTYPAIRLYLVLGMLSVAGAFWLAAGWLPSLAAAALAVLVYPLAEYSIHRFILHARFLYKTPLTAALWKRIHFDHHQDPHDLKVLFGSPANTLPAIVLVTAPLGWLVAGAGGAASALAAGFGLFMFYEFCHCVQHLNVQPRSAYLARIKQRHLAHHFQDESGNFGITSHLWDHVFGTFYGDPKSRPRSASVYNLGYDVEEAGRYPWVAKLTGQLPQTRPPTVGEAAGRGGAA